MMWKIEYFILKRQCSGPKPICVFFLFLVRAWQGLFWDLPLRAFFWDQNLLEGVVTTLTKDSWQNYVTNKSINIDAFINRLGAFTGFFWLCCAIL